MRSAPLLSLCRSLLPPYFEPSSPGKQRSCCSAGQTAQLGYSSPNPQKTCGRLGDSKPWAGPTPSCFLSLPTLPRQSQSLLLTCSAPRRPLSSPPGPQTSAGHHEAARTSGRPPPGAGVLPAVCSTGAGDGGWGCRQRSSKCSGGRPSHQRGARGEPLRCGPRLAGLWRCAGGGPGQACLSDHGGGV